MSSHQGFPRRGGLRRRPTRRPAGSAVPKAIPSAVPKAAAAAVAVVWMGLSGPAGWVSPASAAAGSAGSTCAELVGSGGEGLASPAREAAAAYRTACVLKKGGLDVGGLRALAEKAAALDPTYAPPTDLLGGGTPPLVSASHSITDVVLAVARIAGVLIGLAFVAAMVVRATVGRFRRVRNLVGLQPAVKVEPAPPGATDDLKNLPSLLQSVLGNLGTDVGGQNIQFVSPSSDDVSEIALPAAAAPSQLEYLTWVVALLRPLAPKDRVTVRLTVQPEGRQGLGMTATLVGGPRGRTINSTTLWENDIGLDGIGDEVPLLSERERYQLLVAPLAAWVYFTLADLTQTDRQLVGTRNWRSYGQFSLGCRLYKTHRQRGQRLLREAIDADPDNFGAHLNILLLEFDGRRTESGKEQLELLRIEVEALPGNKFCPRNVRSERPGHWYDPTWYRTMYSYAAVCSHMVSQAANHARDSSRPAMEGTRAQGQEAALDLLGVCWIALNDLLPDGHPERPRRIRGKKARLRYRQRQELALFLGQMLPSSVLLLVNLRLLDTSVPVAGVLSVGSEVRVAGPPHQRRTEWQRRADVLGLLDPRGDTGRTCPDIGSLLSAIDPVEFLPSRARYNAACVHSEVAQYQDTSRPDAATHAAASRASALSEL
ncbi:MAG: hypothetical protein H0T70_11355, partial [Acidimicrobiia bacterium]|nr:hypothetical protein [Acidimicrobiia bacterium]